MPRQGRALDLGSQQGWSLGCLDRSWTRQRSEIGRALSLAKGLGAEVAARNLQLIVLLSEDGADQANDSAIVGEDFDDVGATLDVVIQAS